MDTTTSGAAGGAPRRELASDAADATDGTEKTPSRSFLRTATLGFRYLDQLFDLRCAPTLLEMKLFPNSKEVTESLGAWAAVRSHVLTSIAELRGSTEAPGAVGGAGAAAEDAAARQDTFVVVGDGSTPRTAALFAMLAPSWRAVSIDPQLKYDSVAGEATRGKESDEMRAAVAEWGTKLPNLVMLRRKVQRVRVKARRAIVVMIHCHVSLADCVDCVDASEGIVGVVAMPCCNYHTVQAEWNGRAPDAAEEDINVLCKHREIRSWRARAGERQQLQRHAGTDATAAPTSKAAGVDLWVLPSPLPPKAARGALSLPLKLAAYDEHGGEEAGVDSSVRATVWEKAVACIREAINPGSTLPASKPPAALAYGPSSVGGVASRLLAAAGVECRFVGTGGRPEGDDTNAAGALPAEITTGSLDVVVDCWHLCALLHSLPRAKHDDCVLAAMAKAWSWLRPGGLFLMLAPHTRHVKRKSMRSDAWRIRTRAAYDDHATIEQFGAAYLIACHKVDGEAPPSAAAALTHEDVDRSLVSGELRAYRDEHLERATREWPLLQRAVVEGDLADSPGRTVPAMDDDELRPASAAWLPHLDASPIHESTAHTVAAWLARAAVPAGEIIPDRRVLLNVTVVRQRRTRYCVFLGCEDGVPKQTGRTHSTHSTLQVTVARKMLYAMAIDPHIAMRLAESLRHGDTVGVVGVPGMSRGGLRTVFATDVFLLGDAAKEANATVVV